MGKEEEDENEEKRKRKRKHTKSPKQSLAKLQKVKDH